MEVKLSEDGGEIFVSWRSVSQAKHAAIVAALKAINGAWFERKHKRWSVTPTQADKLHEALVVYGFKFDDELMAAVDAARQRHAGIFYRNLAAMGIPYEWQGERLIILGDHAATMQRLADKYSSAILKLQET